jgi:hypothetical protein
MGKYGYDHLSCAGLREIQKSRVAASVDHFHLTVVRGRLALLSVNYKKNSDMFPSMHPYTT